MPVVGFPSIIRHYYGFGDCVRGSGRFIGYSMVTREK
jgi:hypothetical protein